VFEREQLPGDVRSTLAAALNGDLHFQDLLFTAMMDSWPKLQKSVEEVARLVIAAPWTVIPYAEGDEEPTDQDKQLAADAERMAWGMKPRTARLECGIEGTIRNLVRGYYYGHHVSEIRWERTQRGWEPRACKPVSARFYGYPTDYQTGPDNEDRLMYDPQGAMGSRQFQDFPDGRFLIAIHAGHSGHPSQAAPLRALAQYWLAAVYGLKWFMNFSQLYGIPWRHAECDIEDENAVKAAMATIGSLGYIVTRPGAKINVLDSSKGSDALPQSALLELADRQCEQFILGQTLTSGTDGSGSRALGEVHQGTLDGVVAGVADFVGEILTHQFIPAIIGANYGTGANMPEMWARAEEAKDDKAMAERDVALGIVAGSVPVSKAWFYERHGIPIPADGEGLLSSATPSPAAPGVPVAQTAAVAAADATGASVEELLAKMEDIVKRGSLIDEENIASLLGAAWITGAKESA
jgi:phage gp29-like protein